MDKNIHFYSKAFSRLRVNRSKGLAPHKPILLLSVIGLIGQGKIKQNQIPLSPELIASFLEYWSQLETEAYRPDIALPFFHMKSEGFWHLRAKPGFEAITVFSNQTENYRGPSRFYPVCFSRRGVIQSLTNSFDAKRFGQCLGDEVVSPRKKRHRTHAGN